MSDFNHILIDGYSSSLPYSTSGGGNTPVFTRPNRTGHGTRIKSSFNDAVGEFTQGDLDYDFVFIELESPENFELAFKSLEDAGGNFRLASVKRIVSVLGDVETVIYKASVYLNKNAVSKFLVKIEDYLDANKDTDSGNPKNQTLIANIEQIRAATLESFWQEPIIPFPNKFEVIWWEVWFTNIDDEKLSNQLSILRDNEVVTTDRSLKFPENVVILVKGNAIQLRNSLLYFDSLTEIRKPVETTDFFTYLEKEWEEEFITDLRNRVTNQIESSLVSVCLLDTGVNIGNPLLTDLIPARNLETVNPTWTTADGNRHGHGTQMAGLILYGDLVEPISSSNGITVTSQLESIKILDSRAANDPQLYGQITLEAIALGEIMNPANKRSVCLAVTAPENNLMGKPSSWSAAIDLKLFGDIDDRNDSTVLFASSGNVPIAQKINYPIVNESYSVQDPAQSFNAITVGAFTTKDSIDLQQYPSAIPLASRGQMSPCNSTSLSWTGNWARKPDIVMEGGNDGIYQGGILDADSLKLLSTGVGGINSSWLSVFGDTSASTALATKFGAELIEKYPDYKPETIRGLIVHSATWTSAMLGNRTISQLSKTEFRQLIGLVGYGVPDIQKAKYSAENSLSIIAEKSLTPYKWEQSRVKTNEFHLFNLPWPADVLSDMLNEEVQLSLTLSYFIEPNPGNKMYSSPSSYQSHGLRFKMIDTNEGIEAFKARVSMSIRDEDYETEGGENWVLGSRARDRGSIHKDIWVGRASDLALRNKIAVFPTGGWWKNRKKMNRYDESVNYSLIITIESNDIQNDIYNPVLTQVSVPIEIQI